MNPKTKRPSLVMWIPTLGKRVMNGNMGDCIMLVSPWDFGCILNPFYDI